MVKIQISNKAYKELEDTYRNRLREHISRYRYKEEAVMMDVTYNSKIPIEKGNISRGLTSRRR